MPVYPILYRPTIQKISRFLFANNVRHSCGDKKKSRLIQYAAEEFFHFPRVSFPQNIASAKFCKNKTIAKNSEFTVL